MSYLSDRLILRWLNSDAQMTDAEQLSKLAQAIAQALSGNDARVCDLSLAPRRSVPQGEAELS